MSTDRPLYEGDPEAWDAYLAEGNRTQARKRVSADVLFRDDAGRILLVDPRYKPDWDLPGGMAEANEPPLDAARREITEELGLTFAGGQLLVVDWVAPHGPWDDALAFVFDGGVLSADEIAAIKLRDGELAACHFSSVDEARRTLRPYIWQRVQRSLSAIQSGRTSYLHNGEPT